jgi:hypothetical protein
MGTQATRLIRRVYRDGPFKLRLKLLTNTGAYLQREDVTAISYRIEQSSAYSASSWGKMADSSGAIVHYDVSIPLNSVLSSYESCTNDDGVADTYNFEYIFPTSGASLFPDHSRDYLLTLRITLADGNICVPPEILCTTF